MGEKVIGFDPKNHTFMNISINKNGAKRRGFEDFITKSDLGIKENIVFVYFIDKKYNLNLKESDSYTERVNQAIDKIVSKNDPSAEEKIRNFYKDKFLDYSFLFTCINIAEVHIINRLSHYNDKMLDFKYEKDSCTLKQNDGSRIKGKLVIVGDRYVDLILTANESYIQKSLFNDYETVHNEFNKETQRMIDSGVNKLEISICGIKIQLKLNTIIEDELGKITFRFKNILDY